MVVQSVTNASHAKHATRAAKHQILDFAPNAVVVLSAVFIGCALTVVGVITMGVVHHVPCVTNAQTDVAIVITVSVAITPIHPMYKGVDQTITRVTRVLRVAHVVLTSCFTIVRRISILRLR